MNQFKAGNVKNYLVDWPRITNNEEILENIEGAKSLLSKISDKKWNQNASFTTTEAKAIDEEIWQLPRKEVIKHSFHEQGEYISPIFVITKIDGGIGQFGIWSYKEYVDHIYFKIHDLKKTLKIGANYFIVSLDLKDSYYLIPVEESFQKYSNNIQED